MSTNCSVSIQDCSEESSTLQPMQNVDRDLFWYLLRDYVAGKIKIENLEQDGISCVRLGDAIFKLSSSIVLCSQKDGPKQFDVDSILFFSNYVDSQLYLKYMNEAVAARKIILRRTDVMDLKAFLEAKTDALPKCVNLANTKSPTPYVLAHVLPEIEFEIEYHKSFTYCILKHNIRPELSVTFSGFMCNKKNRWNFLKTWNSKYKIIFCKQYIEFPVTKLVREKLNLSNSVMHIFHAYVTVKGLPPNEFYGCGFGLTRTKALWAAAYELVDRMYDAVLITPKLLFLIDCRAYLTKCKKLLKKWTHELVKSALKFKKLKKAFVKGGVPHWLLNCDAEFEITQSLVEKTKQIIQEVREVLLLSEIKYDAEKRRKRTAHYWDETKSPIKWQNCYLTVVSDNELECDRTESKYGIKSFDGIPTVCLNLFKNNPDNDSVTPPISSQSVLTLKNTNYNPITNLLGDNSEERCCKFEASLNPISSGMRSTRLTPNSEGTETKDSGISSNEDDCQIISVVTKEDKVATVVLDDDEDYIINTSSERVPGYSSPRLPSLLLTSSPKPIPNRIFFPTDCLPDDVADMAQKTTTDAATKNVRRKSPNIECITLDDSHEEKISIESTNDVSEAKSQQKAFCDKFGVTFISSASNVMTLISSRKEKYAEYFASFNDEIWRYFRLKSQDDRTFSSKMLIKEKLFDVVRDLYPMSQLVAVGSTVSGCGSYNSDLDLCLCLKDRNNVYNSKNEFVSNILVALHQQLMHYRREFVRKCDYIDAKVSILKISLKRPYQKFEVDISCNNLHGIYNSHLLHYYSSIDDRFPALALIVKQWAKKRKIVDAYLGLLNSFTLELLVLHFLQCGTYPPILPNLQMLYPHMFSQELDINDFQLFSHLPEPLPRYEVNHTTVGELLIAFFDYYARFDFLNNAISVRRGTVFSRSELPPITQQFKIYVEDPYEQRSTALAVQKMENYRIIQKAFTAARNAFLGFCAGAPSLASISMN